MRKRAPAKDPLNELDLLDLDIPRDSAEALETLREFGLELDALLRMGKATVARFDARRPTGPTANHKRRRGSLK